MGKQHVVHHEPRLTVHPQTVPQGVALMEQQAVAEEVKKQWVQLPSFDFSLGAAGQSEHAPFQNAVWTYPVISSWMVTLVIPMVLKT